MRDLKTLKCVVDRSTVVDGIPWLGRGLTEALLDTTMMDAGVCLGRNCGWVDTSITYWIFVPSWTW